MHCTHTHTHTHTHSHTHTHTHTHPTHMHTHARTHACTHTCTHACMHTHMHACTHICMHAHTHTCTHTPYLIVLINEPGLKGTVKDGGCHSPQQASNHQHPKVGKMLSKNTEKHVSVLTRLGEFSFKGTNQIKATGNTSPH